MPGFYPENEYDLAGFAVGIVDKDKIIDNKKTEVGDVLIALPSSGVHSNGFSLVRRIIEKKSLDINEKYIYLSGRTLGEALLEPTRIYVKPVLSLLKKVTVRGISHITGGGFYENIPRSIPDGLGARIDRTAVRVLPIFDIIKREGSVSEHDMFNTFNMGVGMSITVKKEDADKALSLLKEAGEDAYVFGEIVKSDEKVIL